VVQATVPEILKQAHAMEPGTQKERGVIVAAVVSRKRISAAHVSRTSLG
jgi:hypothetical protein